MPPRFLVEPSDIDVSHVVATKEDIRKVNPHRFEMEQIDAILRYEAESGLCVAIRVVRDDEFWVRGHIPGRPLLPGVIMCEAAAQLCSFYYMHTTEEKDRFFGFGGLDKVKFRGEVKPGDTLILVARAKRVSRRHASFEVQGFVGEKMVYEGDILGIAM